MKLWQAFLGSISSPRKNLNALKLSLPWVFLYTIILSLIISIPISFQLHHTVSGLESDGEDLAKNIPDFSIKDNKLVPKEKGKAMVYQTDSFIFTFDPENKRSKSDLESDLIGNTVALALQKEELVLVTPENPVTETYFSSNAVSVSYSKYNNLSKKRLTNILTNSENYQFIRTVTISAVTLSTLFGILFNLLLYSLIGNIFSKIMRRMIRFSDTFKIMTFSTTIPTVFMALTEYFNLGSLGADFHLPIALFIYLLTVMQLPKIELPKVDS